MAEFHLSGALSQLRSYFSRYERDGVAMEPLAVSSLCAVLDAAAEEAKAIEILAMARVAPMLAKKDETNVVAFPRVKSNSSSNEGPQNVD
ncbi:hypothetical protein [Rhodoblastus sp.]|uniref:hypothetical protein n=1 Tax=Rhodoblastus sp. TaxID=1962975 RepID=UPI003F9CE7A8